MMDKIDSVGEPFANKPSQRKIRKKKGQAVGSFSSLLRSAVGAGEAADHEYEREAPGEPLEELLDDVTALGEALVAAPTLENVRRYRERIGHFMKYLVDHVLAIEERTSGANILKRKKYVLIKSVDGKLEALAREFLSGQRLSIDLAGRVNEINGLLVDLLR